MNKEDVAHIHNGILFIHKYKNFLPFVKTWMDFEDITLMK